MTEMMDLVIKNFKTAIINMLNMLKKKWETWIWWEAKRKVFKRERGWNGISKDEN